MVLGAALLHALWNTMVKGGSEKLVAMCVMTTTGSVVGVLLIMHYALPHPDSWPYLASSLFTHNGYMVFLLLAYRAGDLSQVYPLARGSAPLFLTAHAALFAREWPGGWELAGVLGICAGIISLALTGGKRGARKDVDMASAGTGKRRWLNKMTSSGMLPVWLALGTGLWTSLYTFFDALGARASGSPGGYAAWLFTLVGLPWAVMLMWLRWRQPHRITTRGLVTGVTGGVFSLAAYTLVIWALSLGAMAPIAALRETSVIFVALIGAFYMRESFGLYRILAATLVAAGVVLLNLPP